MNSLKNLTRERKEAVYLDWVNNYLTTEKMAIDYDCSQKELIAIIDEVRNMPKPEKIEFTRINNDVNGNPRYVCHHLDLLSESEYQSFSTNGIISPNQIGQVVRKQEERYKLALKKAKKLGGRKFHNKQYGGGIVFQSYNIHELEKQILELKNK